MTPEQRKRKVQTTREWRLANPDKVREYNTKYNAERKAYQKAYQREYYKANTAKVKAKAKLWRDSHKVEVQERYERSKHRFGITTAEKRYGLEKGEYLQMLDRQGSKCAICHITYDDHLVETGKRLAVDHCHVTGKNRELLCNNCNLGIGHLKDNTLSMHNAIQYIKKHKES